MMDPSDWRTQLQNEARLRIVNKIMDTLKTHLPFSGHEGLEELKKIAVRFEEKIYSAATSQSDYLRKISLKMLTMENKSQNPMSNSLPSNSAGNNKKPQDLGASHSMQPQVHNQAQSLPNQLPVNQSQARQQLLSQNIQNNIATSGVQSSGSLQSAMPTVAGLTQSSIPITANQNPSMQNISGVSHNSVGNSMGQGLPSNIYANAQRQMPGRQQVVAQQQQQQSQNSQQYLYPQQMLLKQKYQQGNLPNTHTQSHIQQQQQHQNLLQPTQLQSSQQTGMQTSSILQPSMMQSAPLSGLQQNQSSSVQPSTQSMFQQHPQSILRQHQQSQQAASIQQQQTSIMQQPLLPTQQQQPLLPTQQQPQQLLGQQSNSTNLQQNQIIGQQNSLGDMQQQQQQQQRLLGQQNNLQNLQQQHQYQQQQQQLMAQQNNLSSVHPQQLGPQSNVSGLQQQQQQQLLVTQSGNSSMQANQQAVHMLQQQKFPLQQQTQQSATNLLPTQAQQSPPQPSQQQYMSQMQSQQAQLQQQQLGLQQQSNPLQRDLQQRLQASGQAPGSLIQTQAGIDQPKQLFQSQRVLPETSTMPLDSTTQTGHANGGDWQEETYQKIKAMKDLYFPDLNAMYQKIASKVQQHDSFSQQPKSQQLEKLKLFKSMLEHLITVLQVSKTDIVPNLKDKLPSYEKQIIGVLNNNIRRSPALQQGQHPQSHLQTMQQPQSQISQMQSRENQMNPQLQTVNLGSVPTMQQNNMSSLQHNSVSSLSGVSTSQQNTMNQLQPGSNLDSGQGIALSSLQHIALQQNPVSTPQQANVNIMSSQSAVNMLQPNVPLQSNSNILQQQHLKQQEQMLQTQQLKQFQQRQMQQQLMQKQPMQQQQSKQQLPTQMQTNQMPQQHQMNDVNELKIRAGMGLKSGVFQQHLPTAQRTAYSQQPMKSGPSFPISSPQLVQAASPQLPQHSSPQVDQQNLISSVTKSGTPLQSANSPFVVPSPSTPLAPSPMPGDSDKPISGISSISNAGNIGHQQTTGAQVHAASLAIGTPGISASPLLAEFSGPEGAHGNATVAATGKSCVTEHPIDRLIKAVKSTSPSALSASVYDIGSVVSMIDRIAGSAPGNGSRAAVGEDLVAMTKCRLQARNFITQDGVMGTKKMKRYTSAMSLNAVSSTGSASESLKQFTGPETSDLESTATSSVKRPRIEANHALLEEIREINQRLIDTVVHISDEDVDPTAAATVAEGGEGTIVKCSFTAVALCPSLKSQYASAQMSPIQPLRLLVPTNYPNYSPIPLDKFPVEVSKEYEDLSAKAKSRFSISLRSLSQPMSLGEIARTWDFCARTVISEHAQQSGGGSFSSKYGNWENCAA